MIYCSNQSSLFSLSSALQWVLDFAGVNFRLCAHRQWAMCLRLSIGDLSNFGSGVIDVRGCLQVPVPRGLGNPDKMAATQTAAASWFLPCACCSCHDLSVCNLLSLSSSKLVIQRSVEQAQLLKSVHAKAQHIMCLFDSHRFLLGSCNSGTHQAWYVQPPGRSKMGQILSCSLCHCPWIFDFWGVLPPLFNHSCSCTALILGCWRLP